MDAKKKGMNDRYREGEGRKEGKKGGREGRREGRKQRIKNGCKVKGRNDR